YITKRESLQCVFVLIDSRLEPQKIDLEFCCWMGECQIPFALVFTKADKQSAPKTDANVAAFKKALKGWFEEIPPNFVTSAEKAMGRDAVLNFITEVNLDFAMPDLSPVED
ncbi:MAG: YihA family ribosome biogenesis GTP-binding protein, partial [Pedobacter sp.]